MEEKAVKGTVTSLSSLFPAEAAHMASKRVEFTIGEKREELNRLNDFVADNTNLINLVQKLPDHLHHDIMVPFGKAAFFPGRLIHTNEFLVLLGDGYYADQTCKQTVDILKRRGKMLQSQVDSLNAVMQDLKAEASFFDTTAFEAAEGLVEIREDYAEENSTERAHESGALEHSSPEADDNKGAVEDEDEEYARMMSRLDELEKEELAAESDSEVDDDEQTNATESDEQIDEVDQNEADADEISDEDFPDHNLIDLQERQPRKPPQQTKDENTITEYSKNKYHHHGDFSDKSTEFTARPLPKDEMPHGRNLTHNVKSNPTENPFLQTGVKDRVESVPSSGNAVSVQTSKPKFDGSKAFTGSIVERTHNLPTNSWGQSTSSQSSGSQPSKPLSRFKMQRK
ncbi:Prefoldin domain-containing protein [Cephalotus follicularis]|uniref:Prefoldin domain-containing protein n=1 Tax=Cephalotus follicularis TaxID=3775 RepID=A0A1Q3CKH1_CEPFO|nr:Prefoldin domain-containing protein [Cephalotus follicularis]